MRNTTIKGIITTVLLLTAAAQVRAQFMSVVYDKVYGDENRIITVLPADDSQMIIAARDNLSFTVSRLDRLGEVIFTRPLPWFTEVNELKLLPGDRILVVGQATHTGGDKNKKRNLPCSGAAAIIDAAGNVETVVNAGAEGSSFICGELIDNSTLILAGTEPELENMRGLLVKIATDGTLRYKYNPQDGEICTNFEVMGAATEYVIAGFSVFQSEGRASVVRLDHNGKPFYATRLPADEFMVSAIRTNIVDGSTIVSGSSMSRGGLVYKLRPEGDIVFEKEIVPPSISAAMEHLCIARNGNILVGGSGNRGHYAMLRSDGTELVSGVVPGFVSGVGMNDMTGESVVTSYDKTTRTGTFNRISAGGKAEFERSVDGNFDNVRILNNSEVVLVSSSEGRICMYSPLGEKLSDRYVADNKPTSFDLTANSYSGEVFFVGMNNRVVKLGHGLFISDAKVTKPVNGYATALFTVTLTGYATTREGAPIPVNVSYSTKEQSATVKNNFTPVGGQLSFSPSSSETNRYLVKQDIEVPIKANDLVEGIKEFELILSDVKQSYLIKPVGNGVIEDHQAIVKLVRTEEGIEATKDVVYELGLFKTDGTTLYNSTGSNIVIDGTYGKGTADALDYDMGATPRVTIPDGRHTSTFNVKTYSDTRYEIPKSIIINFDKAHTISGSNVGFEGAMLSCPGTVIDQPAMVKITPLGDHRLNNNVVSGFFTISLHRASDGALLTNATGSDVVVNCLVDSSTSAREGKDFVLTNMHDLRIIGDGNHSAVNVNGVVLFSPDNAETEVRIAIENLLTPAGAEPLSIAPDGKSASFMIRK